MQYLEEKNRAAGMIYLERILSKGHTFGKLLLKHINVHTGALFIVSPDQINSSYVSQFDSGHAIVEFVSPMIGESAKQISPVLDSNEELAKHVNEIMESSNSICLIENYLFRAGDAWLGRANSCVLTYGNEILHAIFHGDHEAQKVTEAIIEARRIPILIGAVGDLSPSSAKFLQDERMITTETLEIIAETARLVFVGAYDGEGFVLWARELLQS